MYTFAAIIDSKLRFGTSNFITLNIYEEESARFRGALLALFGAPLYKTTDIDDAYCYIIQVTDGALNNWIFTAYEGPSGPAIGYKGIPDKKVELAANALLDELDKIVPHDFVEKLMGEDFGTTVIYGCKDGQCFYKESGVSALVEI
ncbi:hypothetical protein [Paenibacillus sp. FSL R7-0331]|uniref:hypothetical protein n=1 Tax=Paenibacillus sp. FSL R7-0331 TaxID=1536773 RepID=UPI00069429F2|nr:hypothetical protein [Paenibacillus sp. FSL R7-0331]